MLPSSFSSLTVTKKWNYLPFHSWPWRFGCWWWHSFSETNNLPTEVLCSAGVRCFLYTLRITLEIFTFKIFILLKIVTFLFFTFTYTFISNILCIQINHLIKISLQDLHLKMLQCNAISFQDNRIISDFLSVSQFPLPLK